MEEMTIDKKSDSEILRIADSIWKEIAEGCRNKDWNKYSQFFIEADRENPEHKQDILRQWENNPVLTSLTKDNEFLTILRRENETVVVWKIGSTIIDGEFMASLQLATIDSEVKVTGVGLH